MALIRIMTIGQIARKIFGHYFHLPARIYRSIFVDLGAVAESISPYIPKEAMIVDVGGGDGEPLNYLLSLRPDVFVNMLDPNTSIGSFLKPEYLSRVAFYPQTRVREFPLKSKQIPDVILIIDVVHHIPLEKRKDFFNELKSLVSDREEVRIIIKDVEPSYLRSRMGLFADHYISGDKNVSLVGREDLRFLMAQAFGNSLVCEETILFKKDRPNFALVFMNRPVQGSD